MIDEFQDTDPLQYNIFNTLYSKQSDSKQPDSDQPDHALFMIGDPKQAIYSFRGGDIFTYMEARRETEQSGEQYSLDTNWRSSRALLQCVNALFGREAVTAPFIYEEAIGYQQLSPGGRADSAPLRIDGKAPKAMQFWLMEGEEGGQLNIGDAKSLAGRSGGGPPLSRCFNRRIRGGFLLAMTHSKPMILRCWFALMQRVIFFARLCGSVAWRVLPWAMKASTSRTRLKSWCCSASTCRAGK